MAYTLKKLLKLKSGDIAFMALLVAVIFIIGGGVDIFVYSDEMTEKIIQTGIIIAFITYAVYELTFEGIQFGQYFNNIVMMSVTRKNFYAAYVLFALIKNVIGIALIAIMGLIEKAWCVYIYGEKKINDIYMSVFTGKGLVIVICVMVVFTLCSILIGTLILRFEKKAFWTIWAIWMIIGFGPQIIGGRLHIGNDVSADVENIAASFMKADYFTPVCIVAMIIVSAALYVFSFKAFITKQQVTG